MRRIQIDASFCRIQIDASFCRIQIDDIVLSTLSISL